MCNVLQVLCIMWAVQSFLLLELYCSPNVNCKLQIKISKLTLNVAGFFFHLENAADWITWCYALEVYFQALKKEPLNSLFLTGDDGRNLVWTLSTSCSTASVMFKCHFLWRECCAVLDVAFKLKARSGLVFLCPIAVDSGQELFQLQPEMLKPDRHPQWSQWFRKYYWVTRGWCSWRVSYRSIGEDMSTQAWNQ